MKQSISLGRFRDAFQAIRPDNFSYDGLRVLYDFFEEYDKLSEQETTLDVIAFCCDFSEATPDEIGKNYSIPHDQSVEFYLSERTMVCGETQDTIVYASF